MAYQPKSYRKFVATAATATLVASAVAPAASAASNFTDVPDRYAEAVDYLVANGITSGMSPTKFGISEDIKRADAAVMLAKALGIENVDAPDAGFTDVPQRALKAVNALKAAGYINGKTSTKFGSEDPLTRGEVALILSNAYKLDGEDAQVAFTDVSDRYLTAVKALVNNKITSGKTPTSFGTADKIIRGDFAVFLYKVENLEVKVIAPEVVSVSAINAKQAKVNFKGVLPEGVDFTNFELNGGLTVADVKISSDRKSATITASSEFTRNQEYTVSVFGIKNAEGNEYAETKGSFTWEVAEGVKVALEATTLEQGQTVGLTVKDEAGKDVKDAVVKVTSYNTNLVTITNGEGSPSEVIVTANNAKLAGSTDVVVETTLPDGSVLNHTFQVTVKEAVTTVSSAGYSLVDDVIALDETMANTVAFKSFAAAKTSVVEKTGPFELAAFGETNGNPDVENIDFSEATRVVSSNPIIATAVLNDAGVIEVNPLTPGSTTVTVTMKDGSRKTFPITVTATPVQKSIALDATTVKLSDENRKEATAPTQEGVDSHTFKITSLNQFDKAIAFTAGKVTVSSSTEGLELVQGANPLVAGSNEVAFAGASSANVTIVAKKDTPVSNAKVTVSYFAKATDAKPTVTKTITVNVADINPEALTSSIDVKAASEIDANYEVSGGKASIDFSAVPVYALDTKGNRLELLTAAATIADKDADDKYVSVTANKIAFTSPNAALTYLRSSETVDVVVTADNVTKVLPITYKNTAIVPNKATVATSAVSVKLTGDEATAGISIEDLIFGFADNAQLIKDDADLVAGDEVIGVLQTAKNAGYKYNKPLVSILGTDGKALATGVSVYGGSLTDYSANTWNNALLEALKGYDTTAFAADDFSVEYMVANVNDSSTIDEATGIVTPAAGKATTFTLVVTGIYTTGSVTAIEEGTSAAEKAAHNLLAAPVQLNVSVTK